MRCKEKGFSLVEVMIAMAVMLITVAAVFQLLNTSQSRSVSTTALQDANALARESVDQMVREIRLAGYPAANSYPVALGLTYLNSEYVAGGILTVNPYGVMFEADTSNDGLVTNFIYALHVPPGTPGAACAGLPVNANLTSPTLMRSEVPKPAGGGTPPPVLEPYLGDVMNCTMNRPIFVFCPVSPAAAPAGCPTMPQLSSSLPAPRNTRIVMINLQVQTAVRDPQTGLFQNVELFGLAQRVNPDR